MKAEALEKNLIAHPFFQGVPSKYVNFLSRFAREISLEEGSYLFLSGGAAEKFYLIEQGQVSLEIFVPKIGRRVVQVLGDNEVVGWSWLFPPYRWHFDAWVTKPTRAIELDGAQLRAKCEEDHELGYLLMKKFASIAVQRLQATRIQFLDLNRIFPSVKPWWKPGIP